MSGSKHDSGKEFRPELVTPEFIQAISAILASGAEKYAAWNWAEGFDWSRCYGALMRHMLAWYGGEDTDPETGKSHLWHAGCNMMFLISHEYRGLGTDDRPYHGRFVKPE